ncbi:MAG: 30S ribosomal protein S9 [Chitinophagaceae bacterium]|jgi:small subunit ribosomal protein S9|nr:MAG: 30S ribosomal protein S9 [Chitinophagaceae bacterium]
MDVINTLGRRKTSVARVYLKKGSGKILVNGKDYKVYIPVPHLQDKLMKPLVLTELTNEFDIKINAHGGGIKGQAEAITLGIARALVKLNEDLKPILKKEKLLTRDPRMVERKKPGLRKARKRDQFSKR